MGFALCLALPALSAAVHVHPIFVTSGWKPGKSEIGAGTGMGTGAKRRSIAGAVGAKDGYSLPGSSPPTQVCELPDIHTVME